MRRWPLLLAVLGLVACGGGGGGKTTPSTTTAAPRLSDPDQAVRAYVRARPRLAAFRGAKIIVSERVTDEFGVVALEAGPKVVAFPLQLVGATWRVAPAGEIRVRAIGPPPDAVEPVVAQIAAAVDGSSGRGVATMWLDGGTVNPASREFGGEVTLYANLDPPLPPGRHTVVVFASAPREAAALAWSFRVLPE